MRLPERSNRGQARARLDEEEAYVESAGTCDSEVDRVQAELERPPSPFLRQQHTQNCPLNPIPNTKAPARKLNPKKLLPPVTITSAQNTNPVVVAVQNIPGRRMSMEAEKQGVRKMDLSAMKGIDRNPDPFDLPGKHWAASGMTPTYVNAVQEVRDGVLKEDLGLNVHVAVKEHSVQRVGQSVTDDSEVQVVEGAIANGHRAKQVDQSISHDAPNPPAHSDPTQQRLYELGFANQRYEYVDLNPEPDPFLNPPSSQTLPSLGDALPNVNIHPSHSPRSSPPTSSSPGNINNIPDIYDTQPVFKPPEPMHFDCGHPQKANHEYLQAVCGQPDKEGFYRAPEERLVSEERAGVEFLLRQAERGVCRLGMDRRGVWRHA
ncbi:hypothetical protein K469DRAFT_295681 [Zopfia rhizophila CBS 207.26]|uniref:Uncharacterized protein n=1 Tax=Zopfia rhizophila CBS 207.26 TaxID=1314779 RepID=A0A6A6DNF4_9PEZI|nr:hypothetical protein K469DRAFT_295681 [Zopfia rhizophila CBS 207.26]